MGYGDKTIGKEPEKLEPVDVEVTSFAEEPVESKEGKSIGNKLVLTVKHPKREELKLSKAKYENNKSLQESGLWLKEDEDGNLPYFSAVASLLRFYKCGSIAELVGKKIGTVQDSNGFLIAKAY